MAKDTPGDDLSAKLLDDLRHDDQLGWPPKVAAAFLGLKEHTLRKWRGKGGGPTYVRISRARVRYRKRDLVAWMDANRRQSTSEDAPTAPAGEGGVP